ncbi:hypothetical protein IAQ61_012028 [Plenodomus lingam]|uniref:Predicted protein n=1 Tax=Leptosphaeria maculans (strain JN3 / isolate v23.1.3 / race Av1-4-5-6-7-8) TaxID=985895 RepID=E5ABV5_LEPMJ|nr:predicted protein [Plenodomus lingam JN3]KAH9860243.1 hypothetical protein IAQ61_012028 [Plenodomus lingam]CBY01146.1 predicted protein [Plenodomus lingam JN3]
MPIKWTAELDAILLHGVFEECNISFSKALCAKIAERVQAAGMECSAKAVENRLYTWKKKNISGNTNLNASTSNTPTKPAAKKTSTPKTPRGRAKTTPKKVVNYDNGTEGPMDDDEQLMSPSAARGKRALSSASKGFSYAEPDSEPDNADILSSKRVKVELVEPEYSLFEAYATHERSG